MDRAIYDALQLPEMAQRINDRRVRDARAFQILIETKGTSKYLEFAREMGVLGIGSDPNEQLTDLYLKLTESEGVSAAYVLPPGSREFSDLTRLELPYPTPLTPSGAIHVLAEWHDWSWEACRKELQRQRRRRQERGDRADYTLPRGS
ncbi:MAG: hypothetical protein JRS35_27805 [Deltaproteobacteria bacterium]|nr:hypothetical protein [Deltaproteobacteria bacterium]